MPCAEIAIVLVVNGLSLWSMTGVPVSQCTYSIGSVPHTERQLGPVCDRQPKKVPREKLELAMHNACARGNDSRNVGEAPAGEDAR